MSKATWEEYMQAPTVTETKIQQALYDWWQWNCKRYGLPVKAWMHHPDAGKRSLRAAAVLKSMGWQTGVPDVFLSVPAGGYHGLWVELKTKKGRATAEQAEYIAMERALGYRAEICHGYEEAERVFREYLEPLLPVLRG